MKILFLIPPAVTLKDSDGNFVNQVRLHHPKFTPLILSASIKQKLKKEKIPYKLQIIDMKGEQPTKEIKYGEVKYGKRLLSKYRIGQPFESLSTQLKETDVVCLSANFTQEANCVADLCAYIKKVNKKIIIITGGGEATTRNEWYLSHSSDIVVLGEGDLVLPELLVKIHKRKPTSDLLGIAFKNAKGNIVKQVDIHKTYATLDNLPLPLLGLTDCDKYRDTMGLLPSFVKPPLMYFESSRSCPNRCTFCQRSVIAEPFRLMSAERVKEWLDYYQQSGIRTILFCEENLMFRSITEQGRNDLIQIFEYLKKLGFAWEFSVGIQFGLLIRNNKIDKELLKALFYNNTEKKFVGCFRALLSLEHLVEKRRKNEKKLLSFKKEESIIKEIIKTGCPKLHLGIMIGDLNETHATLEETKKRAIKVKEVLSKAAPKDKRTSLHFSIFCRMPLYGTPDWLTYKPHLTYSIDKNPELWTVATSVVNTSDFTAEEISKWRDKLTLYLNGKKDFGHLHESGSIDF